MANETIRIFFPLKIVAYPQGEYGVEGNPIEITPTEAVSYEDAILVAIAKENRLFENDRGLAEYIHDNAHKEKVYSLTAHKKILIDVGHVCQNLYLAGESVGAGTCAIGIYDQKMLDELLKLDGDEEFVIYLAAVGKKLEQLT